MALNFLNDGYFAGKVGIGTTNPGGKLDIAYTGTGGTGTFGIGEGLNISAFTPNITFNDNSSNVSNYAIHLNQNVFTLGRYTSATSQSPDLVLVAGNVGIGTINPQAKLHVNTSDTTKFIGTNADYVANSAGSGVLITTGASTGNTYSQIYAFQSGNTAYANLVIPGGNVGIGTTNPAQNFVVADATNGNGIELVPGATATIQTYNRGTSSYNNINIDTNSARIRSLDYTAFYNGTFTSESMRINTSGNVGIGTTSPNHKLDIYSNENVPLRIHRPNNANLDSAGAWGIGFSTRGDAVNSTTDTRSGIFSYYNGNLFLATNNTRIDLDPDSYARLTILSTGLIKFNAYDSTNNTGTPTYMLGTDASGNVVKVLGGDIPGGGGTVTGSGAVNQVAFWDGSSSLSGDNELYWDNTNGCLGINDTTPSSRLKVASGASDTSIYTVDINHVRNNPDVGTHAMRLNVDLSGADNTTADRLSSGLLIDIDSSANGDASNEHRIYGINSSVNFTGFTDLARGGYFLAESNYTGAKTSQLVGVFGNAVHDVDNVAGGVSNMMGVYGTSSIQDKGDVDNAYGGFFNVVITDSRTETVGTTIGVQGEVEINKATALTYGAMIGVSSLIDNNETTFPIFGSQYLFKGDYQGTKGANAYGIYTEGDKHYFDGNIGIGAANPTSRLSVGGNGITTKIATATIADTTAGASLTLRGGSPTIYFDRTGADPQNKILMDSAGLEFKTGTLDAEGDVDFKIKPAGKLLVPAYTQGFLQSDADGNIDISGGGTLPGGPYLPLDGGTMTGNIVMNNNIELRWKDNGGTERTVLELDSSNNLYLGKSGGGTVNIVSGTSYTTALSFDSSQAATFTGSIKTTQIEIESGVPSILFDETDVTANWRNRVQSGGYRIQYASNGTTFSDYFVLGASANTLAKDTTFTEQAFSAATSSGDASSTLTTKGYVDSLITGATIYRGTWDPDVNLNSGYGNPNLNTVTKTSGYYYICNDDGTATPNGPTCEPDSWAVGDWVIWNDDIPNCAGTGTGAWQKIDNTSVLSGVGTGQTVALWEGASSVTDSETLGNAPITVSGHDVKITSAGDTNLILQSANPGSTSY